MCLRSAPCCQTIIEASLLLSNLIIFVSTEYYFLAFQCSKIYFNFNFTILQLVSSAILVIVGVVVTQSKDDQLSLVSTLPVSVQQAVYHIIFDVREDVNYIPVIIILITCLVSFIVSFLGCLGTCLHKKCMLILVSLLN